MSQLPFFKSDDQTLTLLQTNWRSTLNPLLAIPFLQGVALLNIALVSTKPNVINTRLSRMQQGWIITDIDLPADVSRSEPFNLSTLTLVTSSNCTVSLWVY